MTLHDPSEFDRWVEEMLESPAARAAFEDAQSRHAVIDDLLELRRSFELTQSEVARRMGVKQPTISGFESEGSDPRVSTVQRYARALGWRLRMTLEPAPEVQP